ncbi:MAG: type II secretion system protein GspK [Methylococcaceae bacterium]|nr:type II secretion system protein GspK [Methylococcaceae bacterium]
MQKSGNGFALVIVIWILTLLSLMAGSFALSMRRESSVTAALKNNAEALAVAESGIGMAQYMMKHADPKRRWKRNGTVFSLVRPDGGEIRIRIVSEAGKVDINAGSQEQLRAVIKAVTDDSFQQQHLLNAILDWRDEDDEPRPHGGEKKQYKSAGLAYGPSNKAFQSVEELRLVQGFDEAIFTRIQPWITVYSGLNEVDLHVATPEVLQVLGEDLEHKNVHDAGLEQQLGASNQGSEDQNDEGAGNDENQTYTISIDVQMDEEASASLEAVVKMQGQDNGDIPQQVLDWKPNQLTPSLFTNDTENRLITVEDEFTNDI